MPPLLTPARAWLHPLPSLLLAQGCAPPPLSSRRAAPPPPSPRAGLRPPPHLLIVKIVDMIIKIVAAKIAAKALNSPSCSGS